MIHSLTALVIAIVSCLSGHALVVRSANVTCRTIAPVLGLAVLILITSSCFLLHAPPQTSLAIISLLMSFSVFSLLRRSTLLSSLLSLRPLLLTITLIWIPYYLRFGLDDFITGYHISNDSVMHALMSRGPDGNTSIKDKLLPSESMLTYPLGAHSLINLIYSFVHPDIRGSVFVVGMLAVGFVVFPMITLLSSSEDSSLEKIRNEIMAAFGAATYYNVAVAYHGFLPQVTYIPFALSSLVLLSVVAIKRSTNWQWEVVMAAALGAAAIACYSFASIILLGFGSLITFLGSSWRKQVLITILFSVSILCLLGGNLIIVWHILYGVLGQTIGGGSSSPVLQESASFGNLIGFLNPLMWTGLWWEPDYRFQSLRNVENHLAVLLALGATMVAALGITLPSTGSVLARRLISSGILTYVFVLFSTKSPYPTGKIASFIAPVVTTMVLKGALSTHLRVALKWGLTLGLMVLMTASNINLLANIAALPGTAIESMKSISADYKGRRLLVFSGNDWLLYSLDSREVDIMGLHYLPDNLQLPVEPSKYYAVVFEEGDARRTGYTCLREQLYSPFVVCELGNTSNE